jgi:hypothetical protein
VPKLAEVRDQSDSAPDQAVQGQEPNLYCLGQGHSPALLTEERFFYWDLNQPGCPVCPVCQKQVEAQFVSTNAKGQPVIPQNLLALADRIGERV